MQPENTGKYNINGIIYILAIAARFLNNATKKKTIFYDTKYNFCLMTLFDNKSSEKRCFLSENIQIILILFFLRK